MTRRVDPEETFEPLKRSAKRSKAEPSQENSGKAKRRLKSLRGLGGERHKHFTKTFSARHTRAKYKEKRDRRHE